jgi:hypothetical protein
MIRQQHLIRGTIALATALTASLAPPAWADPAPLARAEATIATNSQSKPAVRPNPDEQTTTLATANPGPCSEVCSGGAGSYGSVSQGSRPPAESGPTQPHSGRPRPSARSETQTLSLAGIQRSGVQAGLQRLSSTASTPPTVVRVVTHNGGFHWGDAGIGAGGILAVVLIGLAAAITLTHRRRIHDAHAS